MSIKKKIQAGEMDYSPADSFVHGILQQEYWRGGHFLFQGIFLTQGSNPGLLHCRQILYHLSHCLLSEPPVCGVFLQQPQQSDTES